MRLSMSVSDLWMKGILILQFQKLSDSYRLHTNMGTVIYSSSLQYNLQLDWLQRIWNVTKILKKHNQTNEQL